MSTHNLLAHTQVCLSFFSIGKVDVIFRMIYHAMSTSSLPLETMKTLYTGFILVTNHQQFIPFVPELGCEPGTTDCESNALVI